MATDIEYALMAGRVYQSTRAEINWLPDLQSLQVTGHSLGGVLAQLVAEVFGFDGATGQFAWISVDEK